MAAAKYARTAGSWGVNNNWSSTSCAAAGATTFPTAGDDVTICNGISIAVEAGAARTADSVTIDTGATATGLTFAAATSSLNVTNNVAIGIPGGAVTKQINVGAGTLTVGGNVTLTGGSAANQDALLTVSTGLITINGGLAINATAATSSTVSITSTGTITVNGAAGVTNEDVLSVGAGTFNVTHASATLTTSDPAIVSVTSVTTGTLSIAGHAVVDSGAVGASSMTVTSGVITVGGNLSVAAAATGADTTGDATVSVTTGRITVAGNVTVTGGNNNNGQDALLRATDVPVVAGNGINIGGALNIVSTVAGSATVSTTVANAQITVAGAGGVNNEDTLSVGPGTFSVTNIAATLTTSDPAIVSVTSVTTGTLSIAGHAVVDSGAVGASSMTVTSGVITVGGNLSVTAAATGTSTTGDATVSVTTGRITVTGNATVTGGNNNNGQDALLRATGAAAVAGNGINIGGALNIVSTIARSATVSTTVTNAQITVAGAGGVNNEDTLSVGPGTFSVTNIAATLTTSDPAIVSVTSVTTGTLSIAGHAVVDSGAVGASSMTVTSGVITVGGNLSVTAAATGTSTSGDATVSVTTGRITVTGNVTVTGGNNNNGQDALLTATGATALGNGINIGGTLNIASTVAGSSTVSLGTGSRVTLTGTSGINNGDTLTIGAGILTITNGGAVLNNSTGAILATTTISSGTLSIVGHLNNAAGETMTFGSGNVTVGGNFTSNGTLTPGTSTVTLNGTAAQTISGTSPVTLRTLAVSNATNPNITLATNVVVNTLTGTVVLTSTCPTDYTLTSTTPAQVLHSCVIPGGFNAFEPPASPTTCATLPVATNSGPIKTKIAGTQYPLCIVALDSAGTPQILTTFNGAVKVEVVPTTNCLTATALATMSPVTLTTGRASLTFDTVANAHMDVSVRISYPTTSPTVTKCSIDKYAIRPNSLSFTVTDGDWETAGTDRTLNNDSTPGGTKHKAGRPFTITATAWNGAGTPAITTNYAGSPEASIASHIIPASCLNGTACTLNSGTFEDGTTSDGIVTSTTANYAEVGAFNMQLVDKTFAAVDAGDSTTAERYITSGTVKVGRFVPDHFSLSSGSSLVPACTTDGAVLSYMGQPFTLLKATLLARNFADDPINERTTENYHFDSDPLLSGYAPATVTWQAENANSGTNLNPPTARLVNVGAAWNKGGYVVNSSTATFNRVGATTPDGPYDNLQLGIALTDPDGPVLNGLDMDAGTNSDCTATPPCTAVKVGDPFSARFGRLRLSNAFGAEQLSLKMPALLEYYDGSKWLPSATDSCTTFATLAGPPAAALTLTPSGSTTPRCGVLTSTCTASSGFVCNSANPVANGILGLCLTAPSVKGFTDVSFGPIPAYLQFNAVTTPSARASFGIYNQGGNSKRIIYRRETR